MLPVKNFARYLLLTDCLKSFWMLTCVNIIEGEERVLMILSF